MYLLPSKEGRKDLVIKVGSIDFGVLLQQASEVSVQLNLVQNYYMRDLNMSCPPDQAAYELEVAARNQHPGIVGAHDMFVVWIRPEDLLGSQHSRDFKAPGKKCLLLVQEMDLIEGGTTLQVMMERVRQQI